ncbi:hypothetical protein PINS_up023572 [Pythium insidiosum]|nr:hypothetical protein PINS_up023572 [Pythium insidiosum]
MRIAHRREQVREASRRRREKRRQEEDFLRRRIEEVTRLQDILETGAPQLPPNIGDMDDEQFRQFLADTVQASRTSRLERLGDVEVSSTERPQQLAVSISPQNSITAPVDDNDHEDAARVAIAQLESFVPRVQDDVERHGADGMRADVWRSGSTLRIHCVRSESLENVEDPSQKAWAVLQSSDAFMSLHPSVRRCEVTQPMDENVLMIRCLIVSKQCHHDAMFMAFRQRSSTKVVVGLKALASDDVKGWVIEAVPRAEPKRWMASFRGSYRLGSEITDSMVAATTALVMADLMR